MASLARKSPPPLPLDGRSLYALAHRLLTQAHHEALGLSEGATWLLARILSEGPGLEIRLSKLAGRMGISERTLARRKRELELLRIDGRPIVTWRMTTAHLRVPKFGHEQTHANLWGFAVDAELLIGALEGAKAAERAAKAEAAAGRAARAVDRARALRAVVGGARTPPADGGNVPPQKGGGTSRSGSGTWFQNYDASPSAAGSDSTAPRSLRGAPQHRSPSGARVASETPPSAPRPAEAKPRGVESPRAPAETEPHEGEQSTPQASVSPADVEFVERAWDALGVRNLDGSASVVASSPTRGVQERRTIAKRIREGWTLEALLCVVAGAAVDPTIRAGRARRAFALAFCDLNGAIARNCHEGRKLREGDARGSPFDFGAELAARMEDPDQ